MNELIKPGESIASWDDFEAVSVDLNCEYWTPTEKGETRHGIYKGIHDREVPDFNDSEKAVMLTCAVFHDPVEDKVFISGSKILVSTVGPLLMGKAVRIEYRGTVRSKSGNKCDDWKVNVMERKVSE